MNFEYYGSQMAEVIESFRPGLLQQDGLIVAVRNDGSCSIVSRLGPAAQ